MLLRSARTWRVSPLSISLAVPLLILYEISIWSVRITERKKAAREAEEEEAEKAEEEAS